MSIEPSQIRTVFIPALPQNPPDERTLQDYEADLIRRFGRIPSWEELANLENRAAGLFSPCGSVDPYKAEIRAARRRQGEITETAMLEAMGNREMTSADIANLTGIHANTIANAGLRLEGMGKVTRTFRRHVTVWKRVAE